MADPGRAAVGLDPDRERIITRPAIALRAWRPMLAPAVRVADVDAELGEGRAHGRDLRFGATIGGMLGQSCPSSAATVAGSSIAIRSRRRATSSSI